MKCEVCIVGYSEFFGNKQLAQLVTEESRGYITQYVPFKHCPECGLSTTAIDPEPMHVWFSLSYSSYLVLPRLIVQSMPASWQHQLVTFLEEIEETLEIDPEYTSSYTVNYTKNNRFAVDPYKDYRRGRIPRRK